MLDTSLRLSREPLGQVSQRVLGAAAIEKESTFKRWWMQQQEQLSGPHPQDGIILHSDPSSFLPQEKVGKGSG